MKIVQGVGPPDPPPPPPRNATCNGSWKITALVERMRMVIFVDCKSTQTLLTSSVALYEKTSKPVRSRGLELYCTSVT